MKSAYFTFTSTLLFTLIIIFSHISHSKPLSKPKLNYILKQLKNTNNETIKIARNKANTENYCIANKQIYRNVPIFSVPKNQSICSFNLFPFKYEIINTLLEIKKETGKLPDIMISQFVLTYYVLYLKNNKQYKISDYVSENEVKHYYDSTTIDPEIIVLLPDDIITGFNSDINHLKILAENGHNQDDKFNFMELIFSLFVIKINKTKKSEQIYPWVSNWNQFKNAFAIVSSESNIVNLEDFEKMDTKGSTKNENEKQNHNFNSKVSSQGGICIFSFGRVCRHFNTKKILDEQTRPMKLTSRQGFFEISIGKSLSQGSEITFSYNIDQSNLTRLMNNGEVVKQNLWDFSGISVEHGKSTFNENQFNLCKALGCMSVTEKFETQPENASFKIYKPLFSNDLMNYSRAYFLKKKFDYQKVLNTFLASENNIWTFVNEVKALIYYFNEINKYSASKTSIFETQKIRNQNSQKGITKNALDFNKLAMLIYKLDFNYKSILINHKLLALSKVIKLTNFDINRLGTKYINKKKNVSK